MIRSRIHIADALQAMRGADMTLCSYAETDALWDLAAALEAGKRMVEALERETKRRKKQEKYR